ncbi:MAG: hypothetical protein R2729_25745 [Bryobacteraceae bacterium]
MEVIAPPSEASGSVAVLAGSFHPITRAHVALAEAALEFAGSVWFVMPRAFPHKRYEDVPLEARIAIVVQAAAAHPRFGVAITEAGLFAEIASEFRASLAPRELAFLCGRDAAERIVGWNYAGGPAIEEQLCGYRLLVADRQGSYAPPAHLAHAVARIEVPLEYGEDSATEVRRRIRQGEPWRHLVPHPAAPLIARAYRGRR